jgi:epoxyqueuosine reductase
MIHEEILAIAKKENVPVIGFGPANLLDNEPVGYRPLDVLPKARSMICFGIPVPRAVYRTPNHAPDFICRTQSLNYRLLDSLAVRFSRLLEESGERAMPIFGCAPMTINQNRDVAGFMNLIRMGEATRIGVIGRNGLLLHVRYGANLMLGGLLTTAVLPQMRYPDIDSPPCPQDCRICIDACPVQAISPEGKRVEIMRCLSHTAYTPLMPKLKFLWQRQFQPDSAARLLNLTALDEHTLHRCSRCVAHCPYGELASTANEIHPE